MVVGVGCEATHTNNHVYFLFAGVRWFLGA